MKDHNRLTTEDRAELIAYLDGEIEDTVAERLEEKIASSFSAQKEVEVLRQTWALLDQLPMPAASGNFTHRTIEMASREIERRALFGATAVLATRRIVFTLLWLAGMGLCAAGGWAAVALWPDPNDRLVQHLPVLERYDAYRAIGDISFLKSLHDTQVLDEIDDLPQPVPTPKQQ